ncbi:MULTISPECIES: DUF1330 domain-containing protein [Tropicimonas]|uniref:Uncharacterized conserved protein, DUF1330 family n=2 Tax=Tropicimonas TaxID=599652 RepID=A0A239CVY3_9RHOB|nr:DUF1330 domain-containing protein [Tropicimonas sediminicola]SNS24022.1 Uncharacterized conserved protein, DUF1330 family [Tropicimonas sediminicola]
MLKGYWVAHVDVKDQQAFEEYKQAAAKPFARYGARFLVRAGQYDVREGELRPRTVVIEFPTFADAMACYDDPDHLAAKAIRDPIADGDLVIVEGYDG